MDKVKKEKIKEAAALQYTPGEDAAPKIIALGKGEIAEKMLETARDNNVPVYKDAELAQTLNKLKIGDEIPSELYEVVAQILLFVGDLDRKFGDMYGISKR